MDLGRKPPPATTRRVNQRRSIFLPKSTSPSKGAGKSLTVKVMKNEIVIYTAIFGEYDTLRNPRCNMPSCDFVCFTDDPLLRSDVWDVRHVNTGNDRARSNRQFKMLPHTHFPEYAVSIYIDGNIQVLRDPKPLVDEVLSRHKIGIPPHPERNCTYVELQRCAEMGLISEPEAERWTRIYEEAQLPQQIGLFENNVIVRVHNDAKVVRLMQAWWEIYQRYGGRDQLSLALLAWQQETEICPISWGPRRSRKYFKIGAHRAEQRHSYRRWAAAHIRINKHLSFFFRVLNYLIDSV